MVETVFGNELKNKLLSGIQKLNKSVSSTLGPGGRNVLIKDQDGSIKVTKDGVTVAKSFSELSDQVEDLGAQLVKQVSIKSANEAGDGTTTSTLLTTVMVEEGIKLIDSGVNPVEVKKAMEEAVAIVVRELKRQAVPVTDDEQLKHVATISGNNDEEIGNLISTALEKVGRDGIVTIEESKTGETQLEVVEGMQFDRGYKSPYFVTDNNSMQSVLIEPMVMLFDGVVSTAAELVPVLSKANAENSSLLIVAHDFGDEALATLIVNKMRGIVKVCAVKAPDFGERRTLSLEDMAVLTGATVISKDKGFKLDKMTSQQIAPMLGRCRTVNVGKEKTTIIDGKGEIEAIEQRADEVKFQIDNAQSMFEREKLQERLGKLVGGVAVISVGGNSEIEIKEKKDRVEDALYATKAALAEGIVAGGGVALYNAQKELSIIDIGHKIVAKACLSPFKTILSNAGVEDYYKPLSKLDSEKKTFNAKTMEVVNAFDNGIIDPVKVTRTAIENAVSVAGTILTTESVVFEKKEEKKNEPELGF